MENNKYLNNLIEQYKAATNTINIDLNSEEFIKDLNAWIARNKVIGENIISLLEELELKYDKKNCAEIGKGYYDSLVLPYNTTIITPYIEMIDKRPGEGKNIKAEFTILGENPILFTDSILTQTRAIDPAQIDTFMTYNLYNNIEITRWSKIHNNSSYNGIIFGISGKTYDKDIEQKLNLLYNLRSLLYDNYVEESATYGDSYCHIIATNSEEKRRKLLRTKTGK